jgi:hypothetical protein
VVKLFTVHLMNLGEEGGSKLFGAINVLMTCIYMKIND